MAHYDLTQTVFLFNFLSNAASNVSGTAPQLADFLNKAVDQGGSWVDPKTGKYLTIDGFIRNMNTRLHGGDWQLVWGPGVYQESGDQAQNALFVVRSPSLNTYVVAMAGTNPNSVYDWLVEDNSVGKHHMADFPVVIGADKPAKKHADPSQVQVSHGTAIGIYNLLTGLVDSDGNPLNLIDYLIGPDIQSGARMIFTGHSLGGALSATLAYQVYQTPGNQCGIQALPTAGPSPGNGKFADAWGMVFPPVPVPDINDGNQVTCLNQLVYNTQDMVPHAWDFILTDDNVPLDGNYPNANTPCFFFDHEGVVDKVVQSQLGVLKGDWIDTLWTEITNARKRGQNASMTRLPSNVGLTGTFPVTHWSDADKTWAQWDLPDNQEFTSLDDFGTGLGLVHVWQYHQFFGINPKGVVRAIQNDL